MSYYIIGAGGVGSWLCPSLCLLLDRSDIHVIDGDTLEEKNLNRQLFTPDDIGGNKALKLADKYQCLAISDFYNFGMIGHEQADWLFVCVDNNPARVAALRACDEYDCRAIVAANETHSAEAYLYCRDWQGTDRDPRVISPGMLTDKAGDPQAAAIGCTGLAQEQTPQLVSANFMAAALAQHLFVLWGMKAIHFPPEVTAKLPHKFVANMSRLETHNAVIVYA